MSEDEKDICSVCGGTGQVSFFQGVSRFLLTTEECDACAGTGLELPVKSVGNKLSEPIPKKKKKS